MIYADTSFLISMLVPDVHASEVQKRTRQLTSSLALTDFHRLEITNGLGLKLFRKEITKAESQKAEIFLQDRLAEGFFEPVAIDYDMVWEKAGFVSKVFTPEFGVRSLDVLHVGCALEAGAGEFWTFDIRQSLLASKCGFTVF
jgi:predicted nucleic acid-binding protein